MLPRQEKIEKKENTFAHLFTSVPLARLPQAISRTTISVSLYPQQAYIKLFRQDFPPLLLYGLKHLNCEPKKIVRTFFISVFEIFIVCSIVFFLGNLGNASRVGYPNIVTCFL